MHPNHMLPAHLRGQANPPAPRRPAFHPDSTPTYRYNKLEGLVRIEAKPIEPDPPEAFGMEPEPTAIEAAKPGA